MSGIMRDVVKAKTDTARYFCFLSPQISPKVADTQSTDPHVIELGHAHSTTVSWHYKSTITQP